jgi:hypothetical protein
VLLTRFQPVTMAVSEDMPLVDKPLCTKVRWMTCQHSMPACLLPLICHCPLSCRLLCDLLL